jgi:23S rRNA (guanosine2251-2'-O)-methyltransferase
VIAPKDHAVGITPPSQGRSGAAETVPYFMVTNLRAPSSELKERDIVDRSARRRRADQRCTRPTCAGRSRWCSAPRAPGCASSPARPATSWSPADGGAVESLNVSVASGICLYEALRQRGTA